MKARAAAIVVTLSGIVAVGCAGVIGITDIQAVDGVDAVAPLPDSAAPLDAQTHDDASVDMPIDAGPDAPVSSGKRVFVTKATMNGGIGGVTTADALCTSAAKDAGLEGTWMAWLATQSKGPATRFTVDGPWSRLDGKLVATNRAQLANGIVNPISLSEHNQPPGAPDTVWTGTQSDGTPSFYQCNDWKDGTATYSGSVGSLASAGTAWTLSSDTGTTFNFTTCPFAAHIYCFEQ